MNNAVEILMDSMDEDNYMFNFDIDIPSASPILPMSTESSPFQNDKLLRINLIKEESFSPGGKRRHLETIIESQEKE